MKEFRRRPREVVDQYLPVVDLDKNEQLGYLTDVTVDGGMLQSSEPVEEGRMYNLRIELSTPIQGSTTIDVEAESVWCRKERNAVFHNSGFKFHNVDEQLETRISELAERYRLMQDG